MTDKVANEIVPVNIEKELRQSYLDYAMSVIVGRALPDVRDGLKPVHRRVLYAMKVLGNDYNKPYKKSARVVGDVIGKYHPHGDSAVYDTIVRMAQDFSMRYMLVDGQGNFGSVDGDSAAAMRYTEVRMAKIAHALLQDIDKETVDFSPNYDETEWIPDVLPTRIPNLLVNGSSGIAVGMATNIPPHNLREVIDGVIALMYHPEMSIEALMEYIPGPDFPTAAYINGKAGIIDAYKTGKGRVVMRAKTRIETTKNGNKQQIIVSQLPYQVNKAKLVEKIAELVKDKKIEGIAELRDESDKEGIRIVIDVKRGDSAEVLLNNLYAQTQLQLSFGVNMVALVKGQPKLLNLKEILDLFIRHRKEVVIRRTIFELKKARARAHILEGLAVALSNIDRMIEIIRGSSTPSEAKEKLLAIAWEGQLVEQMVQGIDQQMYRVADLPAHYGLHEQGYWLSPKQADAILELRLHRLTALEQDKILEEFKQLIVTIEDLIRILKDRDYLLTVICDELKAIQDQFGDTRRSEIIASQVDVDDEDLIEREQMVVTFSYGGYIKSQPVSDYNAQRRGGRGKSATQIKSEDFVYSLSVASTHDTMLYFSTFGKVYWNKVYRLPQAGRNARGKPINNLLPLADGEKITAMLPVDLKEQLTDNVFMATKFGRVKKVALEQFSRPRRDGIYAITLDQADELLHVVLTNGDQEIMLFSDSGKAIRFHESEVRLMGRTAQGVRGMRLTEQQQLVALLNPPSEQHMVMNVSAKGYGKRTPVSAYRKTARGSLGVMAMTTTERTGPIVSAVIAQPQDDAMIMTDQGTLVRFAVSEVRETGRTAQGVKLINRQKDEKVVALQVITYTDDQVTQE